MFSKCARCGHEIEKKQIQGNKVAYLGGYCFEMPFGDSGTVSYRRRIHGLLLCDGCITEFWFGWFTNVGAAMPKEVRDAYGVE